MILFLLINQYHDIFFSHLGTLETSYILGMCERGCRFSHLATRSYTVCILDKGTLQILLIWIDASLIISFIVVQCNSKKSIIAFRVLSFHQGREETLELGLEVKTATPQTQRNLEVVFSDQKHGVSNCTQMRHGKRKQGLSCNGNYTL